MNCKSIQKVLVSIIMITLLICPGLLGHVSFAGDKVKGEWILPPHYPADGFDGWGKADRIGPKEIVIDDVLYALNSNIRYNTPSAPSGLPLSWLKPGTIVGFIKNASNEIVSLWLIDF